jgi:TRAP-type C4-dicarboxylate transport system permease small subunit
MEWMRAGVGLLFASFLSAGLTAGYVLNIVGAVLSWKIGRTARSRFILHIIGLVSIPLGAVMGLIWLFKWRKSDKVTKASDDFPPPLPQPSPPVRRMRGSLIVLGGLVFGFFPIIIALVASIFVDDALNESSSAWGVIPWFTFFTLPLGFAIVIFGLFTGARNIFKRIRNS